MESFRKKTQLVDDNGVKIEKKPIESFFIISCNVLCFVLAILGVLAIFRWFFKSQELKI